VHLESENGARGAVDGVKNSDWGFHTKLEPGAWWDVDLGGEYALTEVRIFNRLSEPDRARTIQVLLSSDGSNWRRVYSHNGERFGGAADNNPLRVPLDHSARYLRLQLAEANYLHLDEVEVYGNEGTTWLEDAATATIGGGSGTGTNLALRRPASQSSIYEGYRVEGQSGQGNDGVKNGGLGFHTKLEPNPWWQVDLGTVSPISEIRIFNRLDCCADRARTIQVLFSNDGSTWTRVFANDGRIFGGTDGKYLSIPLGGRTARFVRLQLAETNHLHLDEVEIFGPR
jgi:hypothetical protein